MSMKQLKEYYKSLIRVGGSGPYTLQIRFGESTTEDEWLERDLENFGMSIRRSYAGPVSDIMKGLQDIIDALESGSYNAGPSNPGQPLKVEDLDSLPPFDFMGYKVKNDK